MGFATRTFLWSFIPFAVLLMGSFWVTQKLVATKVRDGVRSSLRKHQAALARIRSKAELQNRRVLRVVGENSALKAGLQLVLANPASTAARLTIEDQLREICGNLGFEFLIVSDLENRLIAGVMKEHDRFVPLEPKKLHSPSGGFFSDQSRVYQVTSFPVDQGDERIAVLSVGERFDVSDLSVPAVLTLNGQVLMSNLAGIGPETIAGGLKECAQASECEVRLDEQTYLSFVVMRDQLSTGYVLQTLQNLDTAVSPVLSILRGVFITAGLAALVATLMLSGLSSRSIVRPIHAVVFRLRESARTGVLPEFNARAAQVREIRELTESFNRAAVTIRDGKDSLHRAYVEFVGSLASALDARDCYTAGHSRRVSNYSCAIAEAMQLDADDLEEIRIGALLHDIGKIGIPDAVLQKAARLTDEEFSLIQQHPVIGRKILEGVHGFAPYLPTVELHHENWDGSGYPWGLRGTETPVAARIVHLADAFDAMTSDRPYRKGMSVHTAVQALIRKSGTQFDPDIVQAFVRAVQQHQYLFQSDRSTGTQESLQLLADAVAGEAHTSALETVETKAS
ncbi:MAG: HD-GYP domain-containing protein [Bryobacteraceae bacterium]